MRHEIRPREEYIKLGQALKAVSLVATGGEAKDLIEEGKVFVNGESELRRGRKLYPGDQVSLFEDEIIIIE